MKFKIRFMNEWAATVGDITLVEIGYSLFSKFDPYWWWNFRFMFMGVGFAFGMVRKDAVRYMDWGANPVVDHNISYEEDLLENEQ